MSNCAYSVTSTNRKAMMYCELLTCLRDKWPMTTIFQLRTEIDTRMALERELDATARRADAHQRTIDELVVQVADMRRGYEHCKQEHDARKRELVRSR